MLGPTHLRSPPIIFFGKKKNIWQWPNLKLNTDAPNGSVNLKYYSKDLQSTTDQPELKGRRTRRQNADSATRTRKITLMSRYWGTATQHNTAQFNPTQYKTVQCNVIEEQWRWLQRVQTGSERYRQGRQRKGGVWTLPFHTPLPAPLLLYFKDTSRFRSKLRKRRYLRYGLWERD